MISVYFSGRTGNQMFQYAFVRKLYELRGCKDKLAFNFGLVNSSGKAEDGFVDTFKDFNVLEHTVDNRNLMMRYSSPKQFALWLAYQVDSRIKKHDDADRDRWFRRFTHNGLLFTSYVDNDYKALYEIPKEKLLGMKNIVVYGKFENPKFFDDIKPLLQQEFTPIYSERKENKELYEVIRSTNSVCISIRRGDYLSNRFKKDFFVCDNKYFSKAFEEITRQVQSPTFIFFSDDIKWVKENIKVNVPSYYESGNDPIWEKVRLMSSCKHFIISNSTFSWWVQYLSRNPNKVVISPDRWYNNPEMNIQARLLMPEFVRINS